MDEVPITNTEINHMIGESMVDGGDFVMRFAHNLINKCHTHYLAEFSKAFNEEAIKETLLKELSYKNYSGVTLYKILSKEGLAKRLAKAILNLIDDSRYKTGE